MSEQEIRELVEGKKFLVTGGTGSIGSVIVKRLLSYKPQVLRILSNSENELFQLQQKLGREYKHTTRFLVGDIRDKDRILRAMKDIDIVFQAAALKHVPLCEYNPLEAVRTNVLGVSNVIQAAIENKVEKLVNISTDKAVYPVNIMGACKLLGERITSAFSSFSTDTILYSVRFGNVLGSRGSIFPIIEDNLLKGNPIPITDERMTRFIMTISQAVNLVIKTMLFAEGGETFVLKMPRLRIVDLIDAALDLLCEIHGKDRGSVKIKKIGIRVGEKLSESLLTPEELRYSLETDEMILIPSIEKTFGAQLASYEPNPRLETRPISFERYDSEDGPFLSKDEIKGILKSVLEKKESEASA